ncbi:hypothetical protein V1283_001062 [Bradyrhizobium sp. AZCC 2262]
MFYAALVSSPGEGRGRFSITHQVRRLLAIKAKTTASADVAMSEAVIAFERKMAKPNKCYAHRAILVRTMAQAALVDEQGIGVEITVGFAMSRPS